MINRLKNNGWISLYVKDLNGFIGLTVEGALFYLLGIKLTNHDPEVNIEFIHKILKNGPKLQKTAIESFLCEQALNGNLDLVTNLIDAGNDDIDLSITPLLFYLKAFGAKSTIEKVLESPTENDWKALLKLDYKMQLLELHLLRKDFLTEVMTCNLFNQKHSVLIGLKAIAIFDKETAEVYFSKIDSTKEFMKNDFEIILILGICEYRFANYSKALDYLNTCLDIQKRYLGPDHFDIAKTYDFIGMTLQDKGDTDKALNSYEKSLEIRLKNIGSNQASLANLYNNIGTIFYTSGDFDMALEYFEKSLAISSIIRGLDHPAVADTYNNIGGIFDDKGNHDKAIEFFEKSLGIRLKYFGTEDPCIADSYYNIGHALKNKQEFDQALLYCEKSLIIYINNFGEAHPDVAMVYECLGEVLNLKFQYEKSLYYILLCCEIRKKNFGFENILTIKSINMANDISKELGNENDLPDWIKNNLNN